jgi:hypothetical protein
MISLVMLVLLTLIALSAMNATTTSIQVVGNSQLSVEVNAAAQQGIEKVISSNFTASPAASSVAVSFGAANYTAQVEAPTCTGSVGIDTSQLDPSTAVGAACLGSGSAANTGIMGASGVAAPTTQSWCNQQTWDIRASVNDSDSGANTAVHQGVALRVPAGTACP